MTRPQVYASGAPSRDLYLSMFLQLLVVLGGEWRAHCVCQSRKDTTEEMRSICRRYVCGFAVLAPAAVCQHSVWALVARRFLLLTLVVECMPKGSA